MAPGPILAKVRAVSLRVRVVRTLRALALWAVAVGAVLLGSLLADKLGWSDGETTRIVWTAAFGSFALPLGWGLLRPVSTVAAAGLIDVRYGLKDRTASAVQFVPNKIYDLLRKAVTKFAMPSVPSGKLYAGAMASVSTCNGDYQLWESRDEHGKAHVKLARKNTTTNQFELFAELKESSFKNNAQAPQAVAHIRDLILAAQAYATELDRQKRAPTAAEVASSWTSWVPVGTSMISNPSAASRSSR